MLNRALVAASVASFAIACGHTTASTDSGPPAPVIDYVRSQEILTPLPLRVSLPRTTGAEHVVVLYRTWGSHGWKPMELSRSGQTWAGEISCREVSTVTGDTKYFFLALDEDGDVVGGSGTPGWPHVATIVGALPDGAQSLPGGTVPMRCHDPADCPPDFPGCPAYAVRRRACRFDIDCDEGARCAWDGYCGPASADSARLREIEDDDLEAAIQSVTKRFKRIARASR